MTRFSYFTHLECASCGARHEVSLRSVCDGCGRSLAARYDLEAARRELPAPWVGSASTSAIASCGSAALPGLWRWAPLLPARRVADVVTLGEGATPLLPAPALAEALGVAQVWIKEEGVNPTGSFKARGMATAVTMAKALGATRVGVPTAGNAGGALAAYAARAGLEATIVAPKDTPRANLAEIEAVGARLVTVDGTIADAAAHLRGIREKAERAGRPIFDLSTLREPYRVEGKKTMGYEIVAALGGKLPTAIVYPCGGGTGILGMWKAFEEMKSLGWIRGRFPRMIAAQASECAPLVAALRRGAEECIAPARPRTFASGLRVPRPFADWWLLRILRESAGAAVPVTDAAMRRAIRFLGPRTGLFFSPEGAACWPAALSFQWRPTDVVVLFNTAAGSKYL